MQNMQQKNVKTPQKSQKKNVTTAILLMFIVIAASFSGCLSSFHAYVPAQYLDGASGNGWLQNANLTKSESQYLGLITLYTYVYEDNDSRGFPGKLSVSTLKSLSMTQESEAFDTLESEVVVNAQHSGITPGEKIAEGSRELNNGHNASYFIYNGTVHDESVFGFVSDSEVWMRGEVWNCIESRTTIICVGYAIVKSKIGVFAEEDYTTYNEMVDLISNVACHG